jgi:glycosyltransferase involved in cell wall biosynthesis
MRVLALIFSFNDADVIAQSTEAVLRQTRPVDEVLVVDNASRDGTLDQISQKKVTVLRHQDNLGASGALCSGFRYALERGYDWVWTFDADAAPEPDALEKLLELYEGWPQSQQDETGFLACLYHNIDDGIPHHGCLFREDGRIAPCQPGPEPRYYPCHFTIWAGCLYRMEAVRQIGFPNADYVLDWSEGEYGYRVMKAGYKGIVHQDAILRLNIGGYRSVTPVTVKLGPARFSFYEYAPIRCYYSCRNLLYFALNEVTQRSPRLVLGTFVRVTRMMMNFLVRPWNHGEHISAIFRGIWHGVTGNMAARY